MDLDGGVFGAANPHDFGHQAVVWRVRVRLPDAPGALAAVAAALAGQGCNVLGLSVLPIGPELGQPDAVVDEIVLAAPRTMTPDDLTAVVTAAGAACVGVVTASVAELVDGPTSALRDAAGVLSGATSTAEAIGRLLAAETIECDARSANSGGDAVVIDDDGRRARVAVDGAIITVTRRWAPFTELELARVAAFVELLSSAPLPVSTPEVSRPRRQLTSLDVQFLNAETATAGTHIGSLTILDPTGRAGGPVTIGELRRLIGSRIHLVAPLRWRLHTVPLGLDRPYWLDSGAVDLIRHVREAELDAPGTDEQLGQLVGDLASRPLDRDHPLWQVTLVNGLSGGRQALYMKIHHSVIDGVSGAEILAVILDLDRKPRRVPRAPSVVVPEPAPSSGEMIVRSVQNRVRTASALVRSAPSLITHATDIPGAGSVPLAGLLASVTRSSRPFTAPRTRLNRRVGSRRAFAFSTLPLDEVKTVRKAFGLTINDVVMTLCTGAMRRWLEEHDALPSGPLVAGIPVSVRTAEEFGTGGNRITFMITPLPTDLADPLARADRLKMSLANAKRRIAASPPRLLDDGAAMLPQVLHGLVPRTLLTLTRVVPPPINLLVSNVPGPQFALYAAGARVVSNHPVSVISDVTGGVNITVMSYDGHLDIGVVACSRIMPDVWKLSRYLRDALDELLVLVEDSAEDRTESGTRTA